MRALVFGLAAFVVLVTQLAAQAPFPMPQIENAVVGAVGDFDGNGVLDLACTPIGLPPRVEVRLGMPGGNFLPPGPPAIAPWSISAIEACDLNNDGIDDVVGQANTLMFTMLSDGVGGLTTIASVPTNSSITPFTLGDFDSDGFNDVFIFSTSQDRYALLTGDGTGNLTLQAFVDTPWAGRPYATDYDANGNLDVVLPCFDSMIRTLPGDGAGAFGAPINSPIQNAWQSVAFGDVDGNGKLDLALFTSSLKSLVVAYGNAIGKFTQGTPTLLPFTTSNPSFQMQIDDIDGDGLGDVRGSGTSNAIWLLRSNGTGPLGPIEAFNAGVNPGAFMLSDYDNDGLLDAAVANGFTNGETIVSLLRGDSLTGFERNETLQFTNRLAGLAHGDLDADGDEDLVVTLLDGQAARVMLGVGDGTYAAGPLLGAGIDPRAAAIADFTADGLLDVAISSSGGGGRLDVYPGNGVGQFGTPQTITNIGDARGMTAVDLNADALQDLAICVGQLGFKLFFGTPGGALVQGASPGAFFVLRDVDAADLDGDLDQDLVFADVGCCTVFPSTLQVFLNDGTGQVAQLSSWNPGFTINDVRLADFDGDGDADLAALSAASSKLLLYVNDGSAGFSPAPTPIVSVDAGGSVQAPEFPGTAKIEAADVNGDLLVDLVVVGERGGMVTVCWGDGAGNFVPARYLTGSFEPTSLAVFDANRDGRPDIVTSDWGTRTLTFLPNELPPYFEPVGQPCLGSGGFLPRLLPAGTATSGGFVTLTVDRGLGGAPCLLVFGGAFAPVVMTPNCTLWTSPLFAPMFVLPLSGVGAGAGTITLGGVLPPVPSVDVYMQAFVGDSGAPDGIAGTAAVLMHIQ